MSRKTSSVCALCKKPATPPWLPFCSKRCADLDLHRWLGGDYRIETQERPDFPPASPSAEEQD